MKKTVFIIGFIFLSTLPTLLADEINYLAIKDSAAPFQINSDSNRKGIIHDVLLKSIDKSIKLNEKVYPFLRMVKVMQNNKSGQWINYGTPTWEGPQSENLSKEFIMNVTHKFLTKKSFKYKSIKDLFGKRIILITGFGYPGLSKYILEGQISVLRVNNHKAAIKAIQRNRGVAFPEMYSRLRYHMKNLNIKSDNLAIHDASNIIKDYSIYFAYSKNFSKELFKSIDKKVKKLRQTGEIKKIIQSYTE